MATIAKTTIPVNDDFGLAQARLAEQRHDAEREVVAAILADPATLLPVAKEAGLRVGDFWSRDVRLIFCACDVAAHLGKDAVLRLARKALRAEMLWDATSPAWYRGELHSDATLAALSGMYPSAAPLARLRVRQLLALSSRQCVAEDCITKAAALLLKGEAA